MSNKLKMVNGNYVLYIDPKTKKVKRVSSSNILQPKVPETIELKILDYCNLSDVCKWCFQSPEKKGDHATLDRIIYILKKLNKYTEVRLTGGNIFEHPDLKAIIKIANKMDLFISLDLHWQHVVQNASIVESLLKSNSIHKLFVNYDSTGKLDDLKFLDNYPHVYFDVIMGVHKVEDIKKILDFFVGGRVYLHGFKTFGRGAEYRTSVGIDSNIDLWKNKTKDYIDNSNVLLDELAMHQLNFEMASKRKGHKNQVVDKNTSFSMYIDAVTDTYSAEAHDLRKLPLDDGTYDIEKMFKTVRSFTFGNFL